MTEAELERLRAAFLKAASDPRELRRCRKSLRRNLSRKTRFRLFWKHLANSAFIWLTGHGGIGLAVARKVWRI